VIELQHYAAYRQMKKTLRCAL